MNRFLLIFILILTIGSCKKSGNGSSNPFGTRKYYKSSEFVMGVDLSYVNQILDHGGNYRDSGNVEDPYKIFQKYGANVIRFRLFYNPTWTKTIYGASGTQMYNDFADVKNGIGKSKAAGMEVCLDFHYSDTWADPANQKKPAAWDTLTRISVLADTIYNYTLRSLNNLGNNGLMPEYIQLGNEINPGLLLPQGNRWSGNEANMILLLNSAIKAVRDASASNSIKPKIIIHIAQPENVDAWFNGLAAKGLTDYDIIGVSYYYLWSTVSINNVNTYISQIMVKYGKEVMIMETAYPWTTGDADNYNDTFNASKLAPGFSASVEGQYNYLLALTQKIIDGGGKGIFYWEPAWITSNLKTQWGTGSSWDNHTLFDFNGEVIKGMNYMTFQYKF